MAKKRMIFLAIAVLCGFTPWFSWLNYVLLDIIEVFLG